MIERRHAGIRKDLNDLVRDESGRISGSKIGTYAGQAIAGHLMLKHSQALIDHWDSLAIMFTVLIMPEMLKRLLVMKYGGTADPDPAPAATVTTKTTVTA